MKYCEKCRMHITGDKNLCPLCQCKLTGEGSDNEYPEIKRQQSFYSMFYRIFLVSAVGACAAAWAVNAMLPMSGRWWQYVLFGVISLCVTVFFGIHIRRNIPKNITYQTIIISVLCVLWDKYTGGYNWSFDYVIPILCAGAMAALMILSAVLKMPAGNYISYLLTNVFFGIAPAVLYLMGKINIIYPSLICFPISIIIFSALLVFEGRNIYNEIIRRFHA